MIVCSCNVISDHDVRTAVKDERAAQLSAKFTAVSAAARNVDDARAPSKKS